MTVQVLLVPVDAPPQLLDLGAIEALPRLVEMSPPKVEGHYTTAWERVGGMGVGLRMKAKVCSGPFNMVVHDALLALTGTARLHVFVRGPAWFYGFDRPLLSDLIREVNDARA